MLDTKPFNAEDWGLLCERAAISAHARCGLSHSLYVDRYSAAIDAEIASFALEHREEAIAIARGFDYATHAERDAMHEENVELGLCQHGIDMGCCPAGCGS